MDLYIVTEKYNRNGNGIILTHKISYRSSTIKI